MSRSLKPFDGLSLEVVAIDTIADRNVSRQFPAPRPQAQPLGAAIPLLLPTSRHRVPFADTDGWHHGGINE